MSNIKMQNFNDEILPAAAQCLLNIRGEIHNFIQQFNTCNSTILTQQW